MDLPPIAPEPPTGGPKPGKNRRWQWIGAVAVSAGVLWLIGSHLAEQQRVKREMSLVGCNVRELAAVADQYYLEYGVTAVKFPDLVGPDRYLKALQRISVEEYPTRFVQGGTITVTGVAGLRTITYAP
jgi:hypothetical protein